MTIETKTNYAYFVNHTKYFLFSKMRSMACDFINSLEEPQKEELYNELCHGITLLNSEPLLNMYLYAYGKMHEEKLKLAFDNMDEMYRLKGDFAIIDYGCGQGLASVVLHDYLKKFGISQNVRKVILIEPSIVALKRAALHASAVFPNANIVTISKYLDTINKEDIACQNELVFHLFSNILDIESVSIEHITDILSEEKSPNSIYICTSPHFGSTNRSKRLDYFCAKLDAVKNYSCDKKSGEWKKDWSCQIRVLSYSTGDIEELDWDNISTEVFKSDLDKAYVDEYGVKYSQDGKRLLKGSPDLSEYVVKQGTEIICDCAFVGNRFLQNIQIPRSVKIIGDSAFSGCYSLEQIEIPESIKRIGRQSFYYCQSLKDIVLPNGLKVIEDDLFSNCERLQYITLPDSIRKIGNGAFCYCESLVKISLPDSVEEVGEDVFYECYYLEKILIPHNTTSKFTKLLPDYVDLIVERKKEIITRNEMSIQELMELKEDDINFYLTKNKNKLYFTCGDIDYGYCTTEVQRLYDEDRLTKDSIKFVECSTDGGKTWVSCIMRRNI